MSEPGVYRLVARPLRAIKTATSRLPGKGWRRSDMTDRGAYSVEINLTRGDEGAALYINCRAALAAEIASFRDDPQGGLAEALAGQRSFSTWAKGSLRMIGGLPGHEITSLTDGQFAAELFVLSDGLVWQAQALGALEAEVAQMIQLAETDVLPQFLQAVRDGVA